MALSHYDPNFDGLNDDVPVGNGHTTGSTIADRMYRRLHEENNANAVAKPRVGPKVVRPPVALLCYLCGQQFGTASLGIHQKQCYTKKLLQWERGDPETRGPRPVLKVQEPQAQQGSPVGDGSAFSGMSAKEMEAFNNNQFQEFQEQSLVPCENCGRTFFPDRLQVHLRSCKPGASAKPVRRSVDPSSPSNNHTSTPSSSYSALDERPIKRASATVHESSPPQRAQRSTSDIRLPQDSGGSALRGPQSPQPYANINTSITGSDSTDGYFQGRDSRVSSECEVAPASLSPHMGDASPEGKRPTIPNLNLRRGGVDEEAAHSPLDPDVYRDEAEDSASEAPFGDERPATVEANDSYSWMDDGARSTSPSLPQQAKPRPKVAIDRPLDLSHVQSRFKMAAVSSLERCQYCNRTFAPDRLAKHEEVCLEKKRGGPVGVTPRVGGPAKANESIVRPPSSSGPVPRSGAITSRVTSSGYGSSVSRDNGPMTTRGGPSGANKIIRPANAPSRPQSPSLARPSSRSPPPGVQRGSVERGTTGKAAPIKIIQPAPRHPSPQRGSAGFQPSAGFGATAPNLNSSAPPADEAKLKFCTECGTKLFTSTQKFCGECGHRVGT